MGVALHYGRANPYLVYKVAILCSNPYTNKSLALLREATVWPQDMGRKVGTAVPISGGAGSPPNSVAWAEAYLRTKWYLDPSSRLATTDMGRKLEGCTPFWEELGPHLQQCDLGLPPYQVAS